MAVHLGLVTVSALHAGAPLLYSTTHRRPSTQVPAEGSLLMHRRSCTVLVPARQRDWGRGRGTPQTPLTRAVPRWRGRVAEGSALKRRRGCTSRGFESCRHACLPNSASHKSGMRGQHGNGP